MSLKSTTYFVVQDRPRDEHGEGPDDHLFWWSNKDGWVGTKDNATPFKDNSANLPIGDNVRWKEETTYDNAIPNTGEARRAIDRAVCDLLYDKVLKTLVDQERQNLPEEDAAAMFERDTVVFVCGVPVKVTIGLNALNTLTNVEWKKK